MKILEWLWMKNQILPSFSTWKTDFWKSKESFIYEKLAIQVVLLFLSIYSNTFHLIFFQSCTANTAFWKKICMPIKVIIQRFIRFLFESSQKWHCIWTHILLNTACTSAHPHCLKIWLSSHSVGMLRALQQYQYFGF